MKLLRVMFICSIAVVLTSCTSVLPPLVSFAYFTPPVSPASQLGTNTIVYGRFATGPEFAFGNELALRLRNESSKREYLIRLRDKDTVFGIAVEPGRYRIAGFVATFVDHRTVGRRTFPNTGSFEVASHSVTYVGDFTGYATLGIMTQNWGVKGMTNNFHSTTEELRQKYPNLASSPFVSVFEREPR